MLYIVGGTSRSGKSTIAKRMIDSKNITYLSMDWLVMGFTLGIPEYGISDQLFPDDIAARMWPFLKAICECLIWEGKDIVLEGEAILPKHISELTSKFPGKLKACFVGYSEVEIEEKVKDIKLHQNSQHDWLCRESDAYIIKHVENMLQYSKNLKKACVEAGVLYFDTSYDFIKTLDQVIQYLSE